MKKPKIRFKGFNDDWEQRKAEELCSISTGKSNTQDQIDDGKYPFYIRSDIPVRSDKYLYDCEAVITIGDGNIGKVFHYVKGKFDLHQRCYKMTDFNGILGKYYYYFFSTNFYERAMRMTAKGTVDSVRLDMISKMDIKMPKKISEQKKIADCLTKLDNLITLHQRKCDEIKKLKKYMLQNMFPQNDEKVPKIRFDGFTDDWEQRKLGDTVQITMGQSPDGTTYSDIPSNYILIQGNADLQNGWVVPKIWTSQMTKKADAGDLIMSVRAPAGAMGKTAYNAVIGRGVAAIKGNEFIYQLLVKMDSEGFWKSLSCGSTFGSLNTHNIKNADILIPDIAEQTEIGEYFSNLDHLITLHQRKCDELKNMKKFMLQNMFV